MGTEVHDPSPEARFAGLEVLTKGARVTGAQSRASVEPYVQPMDFRWCYVAVFKDIAMEAVEMTVHMVVGLRGEVADVSVHSDSSQVALDRCVTGHLHHASFPRAVALVDVTYAVRFVPPAGAAARKPTAPTAPGAIRWAQRFPGASAMRVDDLAVDSQGHVVAVGTVTGPVTLGDVSLVPQQAATPFVVRLDSQGHAVGGALVAALPHGDAWLLVAVYGDDVMVAGPASTGPGWSAEHSPEGAPFLARVGPDGSVRWTRALPVQKITALAVGTDGAIAFAGTLKERAGTETTMLVRWSKDGVPIWQKVLGEPGNADFHFPAIARSVVIDGDSAVIVAGTVQPFMHAHLDLGQGIVNIRGEPGFIAKFGADGHAVWTRGMAFGEPYTVAAAGGTVAVGGEATCGSERDEGFVLDMDDQTGASRWAYRLPQSRYLIGRVAVSPDGGVSFTERDAEADDKEVVGSIDRTGTVAWTRQVYAPANGPQLPPKLVATPSGLVLLTTRRPPLSDTGYIVGLVR